MGFPTTLAVLEHDISASVDERGRRKYTRKWFVRVANWSFDVPPITWGDIPVQRYDPYVGLEAIDLGAVALSLKCEPVGGRPGDYWVSVDYGSLELKFDRGNTTGDPQRTDQSTDPVTRPWTVTYGSTHGTIPLGPQDLSGNNIVNSVGMPLNGLEKPTTNLTIKIKAFAPYGSSFDPIGAKQYFQDAINSFPMTIQNVSNTVFPRGTMRCVEYSATTENENGNPYYSVEVDLEFKAGITPSQQNTWQPLVVDTSVYRLIKVPTGQPAQPPVQIVDPRTGQPVQPPGVPMDGTGTQLLGGQPIVYLGVPTNQAYYTPAILNNLWTPNYTSTNYVGGGFGANFNTYPLPGTYSFVQYRYADFRQLFNFS
jgi:hypothetical protein